MTFAAMHVLNINYDVVNIHEVCRLMARPQDDDWLK